jgi:uncharacterized protein with PQ loop repeat
MTEAIGWLSSLVLLLTISQQVYKQWHEGTSKGVSRWLFVGQMIASAGFTIYSWLVHNWVFVVTNGLMLVSALVGYAIVLRHRRREATSDGERDDRIASRSQRTQRTTRSATHARSDGEVGLERCSS